MVSDPSESRVAGTEKPPILHRCKLALPSTLKARPQPWSPKHEEIELKKKKLVETCVS